MSFVELWQQQAWLQQPWDFHQIPKASRQQWPKEVQQLWHLLQPWSEIELLHYLAQSEQLTRQRFGLVRSLYTPLYLSNHCVNDCQYCGFASRHRHLPRLALTLDQAEQQALALAQQGFGHLLLVAAEHPKFADAGYYQALVTRLRPNFCHLALEAQLLRLADYQVLRLQGLDSVLFYQETYQRAPYQLMHPRGPKSKLHDRLNGPQSMAQAGIERIGLGILLGMADWRLDALALGLHLCFLQQRQPYSRYSLSLPRFCAAEGSQAQYLLSDHHFVQLNCALRLCFPWVEINLSTRERPAMRQLLAKTTATHLSAASCTAPVSGEQQGSEQFSTQDQRSLAEVSQALAMIGLESLCHEGQARLGRDQL